MSLIKVKYKNEEKEYEKGILISEIAKEYKDDYKYDILVSMIDNRVTSLDTKLNKDCTISFCDISSHSGYVSYEKGIFFLFSVAAREILNCDVKFLHSLDNGIYGQILTNNLISEVTIEKIKMKMRVRVKKKAKAKAKAKIKTKVKKKRVTEMAPRTARVRSSRRRKCADSRVVRRIVPNTCTVISLKL